MTPPPVAPAAATTLAAPAAATATPRPTAAATATPRPASPVAATASPAASAAPSPDADLPDAAAMLDKRLAGGAIGGTYHLDDVRTGDHAGFTRVVWAMTEAEGSPRWTALLRRDVEGTAVIEVTLADVMAIDKPAELSAQAVDSPIIDRVEPRRVADDAVLGFSIRLAHPAGYRVTVLEAPVRVVLDVAHGP